MTEVGRFFDGPLYTEAEDQEVRHRYRRDGIIYEAGNRLAVSAPGGMFVRIDTGEYAMQGFWYKNDSNLDKPIANNTSGSTRVDLLVMRLSRNSNYMHMAISQGTPGLGAPALVTTPDDIYEELIATITVPTGTTAAITSGMIAFNAAVSQIVGFPQEIANGIIQNAHIVDNAVNNRILADDSVDNRVLADNSVALANMQAGSVNVGHIVTGSVNNWIFNYAITTDIWNNSSLAGGYNYIWAGLTFTQSANTRYLLFTGYISVFGNWINGEQCAGVLIDGGSYIFWPATGGVNGSTATMIGGSICRIINSFGTGGHSVSQFLSLSAGASNVYLRGSSNPNYEMSNFGIMEIER